MTIIPNQARVIEHLEAMRERPILYIGRMEHELMERLLWGFKIGCFAAGDVDDGFEKHLEVSRQVIAEHGWEVLAISPSREMKERDLSEEAIIDELLAIEIDIWRRL
jgi:hypothetical protein